MAAEPSRTSNLSAAIVELSSLARACRDRAWQRELLDLAAACSTYSKAPRPDEQARILTRARGLIAAAPHLGQAASMPAASAVIAALLAPPPTEGGAAAAPAPGQAPTTGGTISPLTGPVPEPTASPVPEPVLLSPRQARFPDAADGKVTEPLLAAGPPAGVPLVAIVDNDAASRRVLTTYLGPAGFRVAAFDDGGPAIAKIREERPALVVVDLLLPMMPGEMLILALRRSPLTASIPILVVTAEPWRLGSEHEINGLLTKPVNVTVVVEAAHRLVANAVGTTSLQWSRS